MGVAELGRAELRRVRTERPEQVPDGLGQRGGVVRHQTVVVKLGHNASAGTEQTRQRQRSDLVHGSE